MKKKLDYLGEELSKNLNIKADIVPMIDEGDEDILLDATGIGNRMPLLPVMDQVLFPGVLIPIAARREKSCQLLHDVNISGSPIAVFTQLNESENPTEADLMPMGVIAKVMKVFTVQDTSVAVLQGIVRCINLRVDQYDPYMVAYIDQRPEKPTGTTTVTFKRNVKLLRTQINDLLRNTHRDNDLGSMLSNIGSDKIFVNFAATNLDIDTNDKFKLLECDTYPKRVEKMLEHVATLQHLQQLQHEIDNKTRNVLENQQREIYLRNQLNVIQEELSGPGGVWEEDDIAALQARAEKKQWPAEAKEMFDRELAKMRRMHTQSSDYTVQLNYLETLLDLPWNHCVEEHYDIEYAREVLNSDHYGIEKVKQRVIEYLAVMGRRKAKKLNGSAQVLCLVGPPGTGKTSICRSVAAALDRPYRRVALGGLHDEAEIRGHRRTYVGAMPGRILQEISKAGASNPVFVLDEIDKVQGFTNHGDPSSALLEVLDPEQNCRFHDNFVNVDYDLSHVFFIATANNLSDIQPALRDRMEVIDFSGYIMEEKVEIARRHLLPRILKENAIGVRSMRPTDEILRQVIDNYTREAGVRQLDKQLQKLVRHRAVLMASGEKTTSKVSEDEVRQVLGLPIHNAERANTEPTEGVVTGLAWTPVGGEILFIEASLSKGKGELGMTGNLGDVMKESATLAYQFLKSNNDTFGISQTMLDTNNLHIHVPEGATPKDGPSAGITMFVAMVSAFTHRKVLPNVAMTGEITLRGKVTPVGGIKEKILAAKRAGITHIILCHDNRRDIDDIEPRYIEGLQFHYITNMSEALPLALAE